MTGNSAPQNPVVYVSAGLVHFWEVCGRAYLLQAVCTGSFVLFQLNVKQSGKVQATMALHALQPLDTPANLQCNMSNSLDMVEVEHSVHRPKRHCADKHH